MYHSRKCWTEFFLSCSLWNLLLVYVMRSSHVWNYLEYHDTVHNSESAIQFGSHYCHELHCRKFLQCIYLWILKDWHWHITQGLLCFWTLPAISYSKMNMMLPELYLFLSSGGIIDSVWFDREEYSVSQQGVQ